MMQTFLTTAPHRDHRPNTADLNGTHESRCWRLSKRAVRLLILTAMAASFSLTAMAQNVQFTQGSVGSGLDNSITVPLRSYPGRGSTSLPINLYYNSRVWRIKALGTF